MKKKNQTRAGESPQRQKTPLEPQHIGEVPPGFLIRFAATLSYAALLQACCVRAARGAATVRAKNGALREELGAVIFELRRTNSRD